MSNSSSTRSTLADVLKAVPSIKRYSPAKRKRTANAMNSIWRWTGRPLNEIPATMSALREVFDTIEPAAHGVKRPTVINARNLTMHAMKHSGYVAALAGYRERRQALHPAWAIFFSRLNTMKEKNAFWSIVHYSSDRGTLPHQVDDSSFGAFATFLDETSPRPNQYQSIRTVKRYWNELTERCPDMNLNKVSVPPSRLRRLEFAMSDFSPSFQEEIYRYSAWQSGDDPFAEDARSRPLAKNTINAYRQRIHRAANLLAVSGVDPTLITGLSTLTDPANFKRILRGSLARERSPQHVETFQIATILFQAERDWLKGSQKRLEELKKLKSKLPKPKMIMTDKNKRLVSQFDDPAVLQRLLEAPERIWLRMRNDVNLSGRFRLALSQAAIGLSISVSMPLRLQNLTSLEFGKNIILRPGGTSSLIIPEDQTKGRRAIEFDIPAGVASMIQEYFEVVAPSVVGNRPQYLFCRTDGLCKGIAQVRYLIQTYFKEYVGFHMNPHAFRHLCAKIILDANPGAHVLVQELLGHASVETASTYYAGLNSRRAGRHHHALLAAALAHEAPETKRRARTTRGKMNG